MVEAAEPTDTHIGEVAVIKRNGIDGGLVGGDTTVWQTMRAYVVRNLGVEDVEEVVRLPRVA